MLTKLKDKVQEWISTEAKIMHKIGFKPNMVSGLGVAFGVFSGLAYWIAGALQTYPSIHKAYLFIAVLSLFLSGFCDALDGALARLYGETTLLGGFLDSLLDRYVDAAVLLGLILGGLCDLPWGLLALIGSLLTSYARARSEAAGIPMESIGIIERAERILIIILASILNIVWADLPALNVGIIILAFGSNFTVIQRVIYFYRRTSSKNERFDEKLPS